MRVVARERVAMRRWVIAGVAACWLGFLPAPSSAAPATVGEIANYVGSDRQKVLEDRASKGR